MTVEATVTQTRTMMKIVKPTTMDDHDDDGSDRGSSDAHNENSGPKSKSC